MRWLDALPSNRRRGSFPRCLSFMSGDRSTVANRLTKLVGLPDVLIGPEHFWMPQGLPLLKSNGEWDKHPIAEAKLGEATGFLCDEHREILTSWWLAARERANTPNWDIASTCKIGGRKGFLLVEAKAHLAELKKDGKPRANRPSGGSVDNHKQIGVAIASASAALGETMGGWNLSLDSHYQLANRFAWAWKIASLGFPVVLVYLGFVKATEMKTLGEPFLDYARWSQVVIDHCRGIIPEGAWGQEIKVGSVSVRPLIRVWEQEILA